MHNYFRINIKALSLFIVILLVSCAKIGNIDGGPKDITPPELIASKPANYTKNFKGHKFELEFNEYIQLTDVNNQLNVSPPLKKKPKALVYNKSIKVEFSDTLKDSTTYTFNFGKAIGDFNENNAIKNFEFVLSTTNYLDSMAVKGNIFNAFDLQPFKDPVLVMLYENLNDSAPYRLGPTFTCRSNAKGEFFLNNVKEGRYRLYALKDANSNYKFDPPVEEFGFIDTIIDLNSNLAGQLYKTDSIKQKEEADKAHEKAIADSIKQSKIAKNKKIQKAPESNKANKADGKKEVAIVDSAKMDSIVELKNSHHALPMTLYLFKDYDYRQYMKNNARVDKRRIDIMFNRPLLTDTLDVKLINTKSENWCLPEYSVMRDTFYFWLTDTALINCDTLRLSFHYTGTDKAGRKYLPATDTVLFRYAEKEAKKAKKKKANDDKPEPLPKPERMKVDCSQGSGSINLGSDISFSCQYPLFNVCTDSIKLSKIVDSLDRPVKYTFEKDSLPRKYKLKYKWDEKEKYHLLILPGAFNDIYGLSHDSINLNFTGQSLDQYGKIILSLSNVKQPMIIQLLENEKVVGQKTTTGDGKIVFEFLKPSKYSIKYIYDDNNNGKWDSGCFPEHRQPERVNYAADDFKVRANWDLEQSIELKNK
jgi:uncharacterized protein (DUF2141 family)